MKQHYLKPILLAILLLLYMVLPTGSVETSLADHNFTNGLSHKAISVVRSNAELIASEIEQTQNPKRPYSLGFVAESFTPTQKIDSRIQSRVQDLFQGKITSFSDYSASNETYGFVMILGRLTPEKLQTLSNHGVNLLGYHSSHSYKAKIPADAITKLENLDFIKWVGYSTKKQKLSPVLLDIINETIAPVPIYINLFDDDTFNSTPTKSFASNKEIVRYDVPGRFGKLLEEKGVKIINYDKDLKSYYALATPKVINNVTKLDFVLFVEEERIGTETNDASTPSIGADYLRGTTYDGSGISVGIIDSGYEKDHLDLPEATYTIDYVNSDAYTDNTGHGTHVACTLLGRGTADSKFKGVAPGVDNIQIAKVLKTNGEVNSPQNFTSAMDWMASSPAADLVSISIANSTADCRGTDSYSRKADEKVYNGQIYVVAAGNCGPGGNINQCNPITPGASETITSPGCAKNVITVGSVLDYGNDTIDQISSSSSRGPTSDGRRKPDIVAPGSVVTSCDYQNNNGYVDKLGTSMATPHVSGLIATGLEHYPEWKKNASTVKAVLLATALVHEGDISNVDYAYSHGKVDSYLAHYVMDDPYGWKWGWIYGQVYDGYWQYYDITVPSDTDRLVVVLTWTEPAASAGANSAVINDVDLFIDKGTNEPGCRSGEWSSISGNDNVEYEYIDNPGGDTFRLKFCPYFINDTVSPQQYRAAYMVIRGDPTPTTTLTATASATTVYLGEQFTVTATVEPSSYVSSGVYHRVMNLPTGANVITVLNMTTTREDGVIMWNDSVISLNLGDIRKGDTRAVTWTFNATTLGSKNITLYVNSDNGGTAKTSVNVTVALFPDGHSCTQDSQCQSNYCDNDGVGLSDDNWCFTPYGTYFDGQETSYCEYAADNGIADCDERQVGEDLNKCVGTSYYEEECGSACNYQDVTSVFECTESGCSCAESLCDGGTTGTAITTCAANKTYFADKCTSTASGEDRGDNTCRSSAFASGCTANSQCNGVTAGTSIGTGSCSQTCLYDAFPNVTLVSPENGNISTTGNVVFNCSATDDFNLVNITLHHNITGIWSVNETKNLTGTADSKNFTINNIPDGISFIWNCRTFDNASQIDWADTNYTIFMNITEANITISSLAAISSSGTYKVFEAIILNNGDLSLQNVSWTLNLGDGTTMNSTFKASLAINERLLLYAEHNYSSQGNYIVTMNITASQGVSVMRTSEVSAGALSVSNFSVINSSGTLRTFEAYVKNYMAVSMTNVSWSLNTGNGILSSTSPITLQPQESAFVFVQYNYTATGTFAANFTAVNGSWNDLGALNVTIT